MAMNLGSRKPSPAAWIMRVGWTMPPEPCRNGHLWPRNKFGHCIKCVREYRARRGHFTNTDSAKRWRAKNRQASSDKRRVYNANNPEWTLVVACRRTALRRGLPFDLSPSDIFIPETCPVLGIALRRGIGARTDSSPSLDRIVPDRGYVRDNVIVISWRANRLKQDASLEELRKIADFYNALVSVVGRH